MAKVSLIKLFTKEQHQAILGQYLDNSTAAKAYNVLLAYGEIPQYKESAEYYGTLDTAEWCLASLCATGAAYSWITRAVRPTPTAGCRKRVS